ncbi:ABC transporter substrate-binding protein [Xanthobacter sp. KR7-225]|uniref:ABC transporter substrate-binding protein n=1 Tax=Xanthobacter sp. KR7-225 TaxID=3156613 RepID=UPI0032B3C47A
MLHRRAFTKLVAMMPLAARASSARAEAPARLTIAQPSEGFLYLPIYAARGLGYFHDAGLDVEVTIFGKGAAAALTSVIGGESDIYVGLPAVPLQAWAKGQRTQLFAALLKQCGSDIVLSAEAARRADLGARRTPAEKAQALRGLKIAVAGAGSITDLVVRHVAVYGGLDPDRDLTIIPIGGGGNMIAAFGQGRVDGYCLSAPTSTIGVVTFGGALLFDFAKGEYPPLRDFLFTALSARPEWLAANRSAAVRLVRALARAIETMRTRPAAARAAIGPFYPGVAPAVLDAAWAQALGSLPASLDMDAAGIGKNIDFLTEVRGTRLDVPVAEVFTNAIVTLAAAPSTSRQEPARSAGSKE